MCGITSTVKCIVTPRQAMATEVMIHEKRTLVHLRHGWSCPFDKSFMLLPQRNRKMIVERIMQVRPKPPTPLIFEKVFPYERLSSCSYISLIDL